MQIKQWRQWMGWAGVAWALVGGFTAQAFTAIPLSIEALTRKAQVIVRGTVRSQTCQRDGAGRIFTRLELQVHEVWKGTVETAPLIVVHSGGQIGSEKAVTSGQVCYGLEEEVVAFLVWNERGEGVTVGLAQGKFEVQTPPAKGQKTVQNPYHRPPVAAAASLHKMGSDLPGPMTLTELERRVKGAQQ